MVIYVMEFPVILVLFSSCSYFATVYIFIYIFFLLLNLL